MLVLKKINTHHMGSMLSISDPADPAAAPNRRMLLQSTHLQELPYGKCAPEHVETIINSTIEESASRTPSLNSAVV